MRGGVRRPWYRKARWWVLAALVVLLVTFWLALNPLVAWRANTALSHLQTFRASFSSIAVSVWKGECTVHDLKFVKVPTPPEGEIKRPYFFAKRVEVRIHWKELLLHHRRVADLRVLDPSMNLLEHPDRRQKQLEPEEPHLHERLRELAPFDIERVQVRHGQVTFIDAAEPNRPVIWLHDLEVSLENVASRVGLAHGEPSVLAARGKLQRSGQVSVFVTADPLARTLAFAGRASVRGLNLAELGKLVVDKTGLAVKQGKVDVFIEFDAHHGHLTGGVKPVLTDVDLGAGRPGLGPKFKAFLADAALDLASHETPRGKTTATIVPITGSIKDPKAQLWPTVWAALRNAFAEGVSVGFKGLPPAEKKRETLLKEAGHASSQPAPPARGAT